MHHRGTPTPGRHRAAHQEGSLSQVTFVGSFPTAAFAVSPTLPEVALLGRSNVGKSSLLNALVGRKAIARISKTPGKTRDCNVYRMDDRLYLVDLPGYGYARVSKTERQRLRELVGRYLRARDALAGVVWLLDVRRTPSTDDVSMAERLREREIPVLLAVTKADKLARSHRAQQVRAILDVVHLEEDQAVLTSAVTKQGVSDLKESILEFVGDLRGKA